MKLEDLIDKASLIAGSQNRLAALLNVSSGNLSGMRAGKRLCGWRLRAKMRVILGESPSRAYIATMAEELAESENEDEKKAAEALLAILAAFPNDDVERAMGIEPTS